MNEETSMNLQITMAIISAASALLGALIGVFSNILLQKLQKNAEIREALRKTRSQAYWEFIENMQEFMNATNKEQAHINFYKSLNKLKLYASNKVTKTAVKYYNEMAFTRQSNPLNADEHAKYQTELINLMREDSNNEKSDIPDLRLVAFRPNIS